MSSQVLGIDLGTSKYALAVAKTEQPDVASVVATPTGAKSSPPMVSFRGMARQVGEAAAMQQRSNAENTITDIVYYLGRADASEAKSNSVDFARRWQLAPTKENPVAVVDYNSNSDTQLDMRLVASMVLRQAKEYFSSAGHDGSSSYALSCPDSFSEEQRAALSDAGRLAGLDIQEVVGTSMCLATSYRSGLLASKSTDETTVMFVNIGHTYSSVSVVKFVPSVNVQGNPDFEMHTLTCKSTDSLGARDTDIVLYRLVQEELEKQDVQVDPKTKVGTRIFAQCNKAKKILSTITTADVVLENLPGDKNARITFSRAQLDDKCSGLCDKLGSLLQAAVEELAAQGVELSSLSSVEMSGGGSRIPCLRTVVQECIGNGVQLMTTLSPEAVPQGAATIGARNKLIASSSKTDSATAPSTAESKEEGKQQAGDDEASTAATGTETGVAADASDKVNNEGAATPAEATAEASVAESSSVDAPAAPATEPPAPSVPASQLTEEQLKTFAQIEEDMRRVDAELMALNAAKNSLESYIFEMRTACEGGGSNAKHASLLDSAALLPQLDEAEDLVYSDDPHPASAFLEKLEALKKSFTDTSPAYFEAIQKEREQLEEELRRAEKQAAEERKASGEDDDHDTRKLKKADRMRLVKRNKDEGTELFKGTNYAHAAARYTKALGHCSKFVDLSPDDQQEVNDVKVSLYLNLAMCYIKLEKWERVVPNCKDVLSFQPENVKAMFRRATALVHLKDIKGAKKDVEAALKLDSENKSLLKLQRKIEKIVKKQKAKEKKMAKAMFGGA